MSTIPFHTAADPAPLVDASKARYVVGALGLLIRVVGGRTCLGMILQQARSEVVSLLRSQEEEAAGRTAAAA
jgi:hypothetical protein